MSIFTNQKELSVQNRYKDYEKTGGMRGKMLGAMQSNLNPLNYVAPALTHGASELLATGDDKDVLKENRGQAIANQMAVGKFAMNFVPGGAAAKAIGGEFIDEAISSVGKSKEERRRENTNSKFQKQIAKDTEDGMFGSDTSALVDSIESENATAEAMDGLEATTSGKDITKAQKFQKGFGKAANIAGIATEGMGLIMNQLDYQKGLQSDREKVMSKTINKGEFSYA